MKDREHLYQLLPQVGEYLDSGEGRKLTQRFRRQEVRDALRAEVARLRQAIQLGQLIKDELEQRLDELPLSLESILQAGTSQALRPVVNATGVMLQTNLGRAPLSERAIERIAQVARGYCNLEFDLHSGERGERGAHVEHVILKLLAAPAPRQPIQQSALIVNNCAAATFLALNSLAAGAEVIVSRGELVEIGGGFRIPEILEKSGARLREVGTTNRTRIEDYAAAATPDTRLILRVHPSNFRIEGFTHRPTLDELVRLGQRTNLPIFEDQGTGCVVDMRQCAIGETSSLLRSARSGAALVAASGDKLLGGPQCGILVGDRIIVDRLRTNPLYRALRVDKLTYAALDMTLLAHLEGDLDSIPIFHMLNMPADLIRDRCERWVQRLDGATLRAEVVAAQSVIGGGTTPGISVPSYAVELTHADIADEELARRLRDLTPPVIARVTAGRALLDLRTVGEEWDATLPGLISESLERNRSPIEREKPA